MQDPNSVHSSWRAYFEGLKGGLPSQQAFQSPPGLVPSLGDSIEGAAPVAIGAGGEIEDHMKVRLPAPSSPPRHRRDSIADPTLLPNGRSSSSSARTRSAVTTLPSSTRSA